MPQEALELCIQASKIAMRVEGKLGFNFRATVCLLFKVYGGNGEYFYYKKVKMFEKHFLKGKLVLKTHYINSNIWNVVFKYGQWYCDLIRVNCKIEMLQVNLEILEVWMGPNSYSTNLKIVIMILIFFHITLWLDIRNKIVTDQKDSQTNFW